MAVEMPRPDIEIDQPQPEVEVAEAAPAEVEVQQAAAQVQVEQAEGAAVEVEQGEAQLQVEQAEPQIQVEQAEPRVNVVRAGEQDQLQEEQQEAAAVAQEELAAVEEEPEVAAQNPLAALSANQVLGADVVTTEGQEIAEIEDIVRARTGGEQLYAILSVGGFLGLGDKDVAIDFDRLEVGSDGQIVMPAATESQLEEMPAYTQDDYESVIR